LSVRLKVDGSVLCKLVCFQGSWFTVQSSRVPGFNVQGLWDSEFGDQSLGFLVHSVAFRDVYGTDIREQ